MNVKYFKKSYFQKSTIRRLKTLKNSVFHLVQAFIIVMSKIQQKIEKSHDNVVEI